MIHNKKIEKLVNNFQNVKILVIGDFMLDEYIFGNVERISPEAPVPIVEEKSRKYIPGGAGNVVLNLQSLGIKTIACGVIGKDWAGKILKEKLAKGLVDLLIEIHKPTTLKTRIIGGHQQICRLDKEDRSPVDSKILKKVISKIESQIQDVQGIIISDYDKGLIQPELIHKIVDIAKRNHIPVGVDPQVPHFSYYKDVFIVTPNHHEAGRFINKKLITDQEVESGGKEILNILNCDYVLITRGDKGMSLISQNIIKHIPTFAKEVFDVTGAGDTVISVLMATYCSEGDIELATEISNYAAGIVVGKLGAASVIPDELLNYNL